MRSKNSRGIRGDEEQRLAAVKSVACVTCDADPPSLAHHPIQGLHFVAIAFCEDCHVGPGGIHGDGTMMRLKFGAADQRAVLRAVHLTLERVAALEPAEVLHA